MEPVFEIRQSDIDKIFVYFPLRFEPLRHLCHRQIVLFLNLRKMIIYQMEELPVEKFRQISQQSKPCAFSQ